VTIDTSRIERSEFVGSGGAQALGTLHSLAGLRHLTKEHVHLQKCNNKSLIHDFTEVLNFFEHGGCHVLPGFNSNKL